jgi:opacity protein-like surface antigen
MKRYLSLLLILAFVLPSYAGDISRKGTTGADQLLIPVGARGIATGGAFVSSVTGMESVFYNPAGLDIDRKTEAMFSYMSYIADINISYFAAGTSLGEFGSVALSFKTMNFGDIPITTVNNPDGDGTTYSPGFLVAGLTYSKIITDRVSIGFNAKVISETIMNTNATGFALDFGVQYRFNKNLTIGAAVKNVGTNMQYTGQDLQFKTTVPGTVPGSTNGNLQAVTEPFQIPSYFELSVGYRFDFDKESNLLLGSTFVNNNAFEDEFKFGAEYSFQNLFFLRGGYSLQSANNDKAVYGLNLGGGINYKLTDEIGVVVDYAFRSVKEFPTANHIVTVKLSFR